MSTGSNARRFSTSLKQILTMTLLVCCLLAGVALAQALYGSLAGTVVSLNMSLRWMSTSTEAVPTPQLRITMKSRLTGTSSWPMTTVTTSVPSRCSIALRSEVAAQTGLHGNCGSAR